MRRETLTESQTATLSLSEDEAVALAQAGRQLASDRSWWGDSDEIESPEPSVIRVVPVSAGQWSVRVVDAVGHIAIGDLQLSVQPKIPVSHLLYLFERADRIPRTEDERAAVSEGDNFWELIARWFIRQAETVLRRDLVRDYQEVEESLRVLRGRVQPLLTARSYYSGRLTLHCEFEEFGIDSAPNRILKAAARAVAKSTLLHHDLRQRAMAILARTGEVGELQSGDLRIRLDRRTRHYRDALSLSRHILSGTTRFLAHGESLAWTFLIRTPEMIEDGVRNVLADGLGSEHRVEKRGMQLVGSSMTLNPDLVFDHSLAIGDVKYKIAGSDWKRSDLYQSVAFAEGFRCGSGMIIDFAEGEAVLPAVRIGSKTIHHSPWRTRLEPARAADELVGRARDWLLSLADAKAA